jgi:hypothetical protein
VVISGMGKTPFEPNTPTVRETFTMLKSLFDSGFPSRQVLVVVDPVIPNDNGLNSLKLLLRLFSEFPTLRLRFMRFRVLKYGEDNRINNYNIRYRMKGYPALREYIVNVNSFNKSYRDIINKYRSIITVDSGEEPLLGSRELLTLGYKNEWVEPDGTVSKVINYANGNKYDPIVNDLCQGKPVRCSTRCVLCPYRY